MLDISDNLSHEWHIHIIMYLVSSSGLAYYLWPQYVEANKHSKTCKQIHTNKEEYKEDFACRVIVLFTER